MTRALMAILRSDDEITALACRSPIDTADPVLRALESWVADLDRQPLPDISVDHVFSPAVAGGAAGRVVRRSLALAVALTLSSTGVAAAVNGNPWAPINFVVTTITTLGHPEDVARPNVGAAEPADAGAFGGDHDRKRPSEGDRAARDHQRELGEDTSTDSSTPLVASSPVSDHDTSNGAPAHDRPAVPVVQPTDNPPHDKPTKPHVDRPQQSPRPPVVEEPPDSQFPAPKPGTDPPPADTD